MVSGTLWEWASETRNLLLIVVIALIGLFLGLWLPERARQRRWDFAREAEKVLWLIHKAEWVYFEKDADSNGVHDYWTGDIAGLYKYGLIDRSIAEADARPISPLVSKPIPKNGYLFIALDSDNSVSPPEPYRQDTDDKSGRVHHLKRFGFLAYPVQVHEDLRMMALNENGSARVPPKDQAPPTYWPSDDEIKGWGRTGE